MRGEKYDRDLDVVAIAKLVRADIKAAIKAGKLPRGTKTSVRTSRFSGGESLTVVIKSVPGARVLSRRRMQLELDDPHRSYHLEPLYSKEGKRILGVVENIVKAYNRDDSDIDTDYWSVHFYEDVKFSYEIVSREREAFANRWRLTDAEPTYSMESANSGEGRKGRSGDSWH